MIYFLFGKPGAGKSTLGRNVSQQVGIPYVDCDNLYTPVDRVRIQKGEFTNEESDAFLARVINTLQAYQKETTSIVASQSLFRESQRDELKRAFPGTIRLIYLDVDDEICLKRLDDRQHVSMGPERELHFYSREHFLVEIDEFEPPKEVNLWIKNNGSLEKTEQVFVQYIRET